MGMGRMTGMMRAMMGQYGMGMMTGHVEGRLAFLKTELKITDAQLPLWNKFADAVRDNAKAMKEMMQVGTTGDEPGGDVAGQAGGARKDDDGSSRRAPQIDDRTSIRSMPRSAPSRRRPPTS